MQCIIVLFEFLVECTKRQYYSCLKGRSKTNGVDLLGVQFEDKTISINHCYTTLTSNTC